MKKQIPFIVLLLLCVFSGFAQNVNFVVFSEDLEPFFIYVNGIQQNANPETNVRVAGVTPNISLRVEFVNKALPVIKQNMSLEPGFEHTARLKKDKNQVMKLKYFGQVPMEQAVPDKAVSTVNYHTSPEAETNDASANTQISTTTTSTTTTRVQADQPKNENANVNVTMPGVGISMIVTDPSAVNTIQTTTSSTVTTTSNGGSSIRSNNESTPKPTSTETTSHGCSTTMSAANFTKMKESIASKPFSDARMSTAKVATKNNCLSVNQVKEITKLFSMDDDKLTYAKYAYDYCSDKANYYQVSEVFAFSATTEEFNAFLEK